jgi:hypothetical protein
VNVTQSFAVGVPFFVWAEVPRWVERPIPAEIRSYEDLESFVPQAAAAAGLDADQPLPFLVSGWEDLIDFHILNRIGDAPHNMETHKKTRSGSSWSGSRRPLSAFTRPAIAASLPPATATSTSISRRRTTASPVISRRLRSVAERCSACPRGNRDVTRGNRDVPLRDGTRPERDGRERSDGDVAHPAPVSRYPFSGRCGVFRPRPASGSRRRTT